MEKLIRGFTFQKFIGILLMRYMAIRTHSPNKSWIERTKTRRLETPLISACVSFPQHDFVMVPEHNLYDV